MGIISHDVDYFYYGADLHFYQQISDRWYAAEMTKLVSSSSENIPYYFQQSLTSSDDFIRGFDYYALSGDADVLFQEQPEIQCDQARDYGGHGRRRTRIANSGMCPMPSI